MVICIVVELFFGEIFWVVIIVVIFVDDNDEFLVEEFG